MVLQFKIGRISIRKSDAPLAALRLDICFTLYDRRYFAFKKKILAAQKKGKMGGPNETR